MKQLFIFQSIEAVGIACTPLSGIILVMSCGQFWPQQGSWGHLWPHYICSSLKREPIAPKSIAFISQMSKKGKSNELHGAYVMRSLSLPYPKKDLGMTTTKILIVCLAKNQVVTGTWPVTECIITHLNMFSWYRNSALSVTPWNDTFSEYGPYRA